MNSYQIILLIIVVVIITLLFVYGRNLVNPILGTYGTMGGFQRITLLIAMIILVIILIFIGGSLAYASKNAPDAPLIAQCPDFWEIEETSAGPKCINVQNLGTCPAANGDKHLIVDFNSGNFTNNCSKYTWANNCNIAWDGLTYGVDNPCTEPVPSSATKTDATATAAKS
jgi:hypothetical protein